MGLSFHLFAVSTSMESSQRLRQESRIQIDLSILTSIPPRRLTMRAHSSMEALQDLHNPQHWDLGYVRSDKNREAYETIRESILDALDFVESTGVSGQGAFRTVELFASHEGLLLPYEEAHTIPNKRALVQPRCPYALDWRPNPAA